MKTGKAERLCGFEPHSLRQIIHIVVIGSVLGILAGCFGSDLHPAYIAAVSLPESITGQDPVSVDVYTFHGDCTVETKGTSFSAVNDSTFEIQIRNTSGTPGIGCPGGIWPRQFVLPHPPSKRFHIRFVGHNTVETTVNRGIEPPPGVREIFRFDGSFGVPPDSLSVLLVGGTGACADTLGIVRADAHGTAVFEGPCTLDDREFRAEAPYQLHTGLSLNLQGRFHCGLPRRTIIESSN